MGAQDSRNERCDRDGITEYTFVERNRLNNNIAQCILLYCQDFGWFVLRVTYKTGLGLDDWSY
jgi:hypothetical protein